MVIKIATHYQTLATYAIAAFGAQRLLKERQEAEDEGRSWTKEDEIKLLENLAGREDISSDPAAKLKRISDAIQDEINRLFDRKVRQTYVGNYFDNVVKDGVRSLMEARQATAGHIVGLMHQTFPYLNFTALVYDGVMDTGDEHRHAWNVRGADWGLITERRLPLPGKDSGADSDDKRNILIYFAPRHAKETPVTQTLPDLNAPSPKRRKAAKSISAELNKLKHGGLHTQWKKIRHESSTLADVIVPTYSDTVWDGSSNWGNDMVWVGYTDNCERNFMEEIAGDSDDQERSNALQTLDQFLGVASQNRIGIEVKYTPEPYKQTVSGILFHYECRYYQVITISDDAH